MEEKRKGNVQEVKEAMAAGVCAVHCWKRQRKVRGCEVFRNMGYLEAGFEQYAEA